MIGKKIKEARKKARMTQADLAAACGFDSQGTISNYEKGIRQPKVADIEKIALATNRDMLEFFSSNGLENGSVREPESPYILDAGIPLISFIQAGRWADAIDNYHAGDAEDWFPALPGMNKRVFALRVTGDSMTSPYPGQRSYPEGTIIYVDPDRRSENGQRVVAKYLDINEATFKQYREESGKKYLQPLNPQYEMIELNDGIKIIGVVIHSFIPE